MHRSSSLVLAWLPTHRGQFLASILSIHILSSHTRRHDDYEDLDLSDFGSVCPCRERKIVLDTHCFTVRLNDCWEASCLFGVLLDPSHWPLDAESLGFDRKAVDVAGVLGKLHDTRRHVQTLEERRGLLFASTLYIITTTFWSRPQDH